VGGKTSTTSSNVAVPPAVLAQYQSVVNSANQTAQTPFEKYGGEFVAPVNSEQSQGISATNAAANEAQPYYGAATGTLGATQAATAPVNTAAEIGTAESAAPLTGSQIDQYLSPYLGTVLGSTEAIQNQENQQQQAGQLGNAITSGAFGSDRTGIAAANLGQQQSLANANIISGIANTGYQSALSTAQGQQQIGLAGAQQLANIGQTAYGEGANTASELGALGTGAQSAGLAGAQAQISAGTVQQQTQQAQDTAAYNQFLQQQSYPFQVGQWLADISEGTGSLSGSTTTTTQPGGFFSDKRLKRDIKKIGETFDGQDVVTYKMGEDERTRIGLIAQDVEKKHPHAVGLAGGFKVVDYGKATQEAANKGHFYAGGVVPMRRVHRDTGGGLAGVLQAQQQMYASMPGSGQQRRQINSTTGGGGHSLAVTNAPASPPPSGSSELGQSISLAEKADKLYKSMSAPSAAPSGVGSTDPAVQSAWNSYNAGLGYDTGATSVVSEPAAATGVAPSSSLSAAGLQPSGVITAGAPEATATAAPAASGVAAAPGAAAGAGDAAAAAAPAAASAASAAAPAAAEAAGTAAAGAAGTAAVGAGTTAAAEAAAAIAAEYAAADVGAAAVMMANRGGAVRRGYDSGGMPYSGGAGLAGPYAEPQGDINIPNQPNTNTLKAAPAAGKQPTGLQSILYMSNPNDTSSLMGSMFSNQALATGGVAGRRGFDDGGDATDADSDTPPAADTAPAAAPATGLAGWWGRNKGLVVPILAGIGAAGTERSVHPGVALAAGLEAAANAYVPTQEGLARAQEREATAQSTQIANRLAAIKLGVAQHAFAPTPGGLAPQPAAPQSTPPPQTINPAPATIASTPSASAQAPAPPASPGQQPSPSAAQTAAGLAAQYRSRFFVNQARTPEEQAAKDAAIKNDWAVGGTMFSQQADTDFQARVQRDQQNNRNAAQQAADAQYATATDQASPPAARQAALARYNALRQWTGDGTALEGGIVRNTRTNQPEIGPIAQQGFTPSDRSAAMAKAQELVNVPNTDGTSTQMPAWQAHHAPSIESYAQTLLPNWPGAAPTTSNQPSPSTAVTGKTPARALAMSPAGVIPVAHSQTSPVSPYLAKALSDTSFRVPPAPVRQGTTQAPMALDTQKTNLANAAKLLADTDATTAVAASTLQYIRAAQSIMQSQGATVGAYGGVLSDASRYSGPFTGKVDSTNFQELAKYLGNAAAQSAKANFPSATQQEVGMQFEEMSPNVKMNDDTINDLLAVNARVAANVIANGKRAKAYIGNPQSPTNQPLNFGKWSQLYYPVEKIANADKIAVNPKTGEKLYHINGQWVP
jgi:hypothetical protein